MKTFITALMLVFALASGILLITLAFRTDVREPAGMSSLGDVRVSPQRSKHE